MKSISKLITICLLLVPLLLSQCKKLTSDVDCKFPATVTVTNITNVSAEASWSQAEDAEQYLFEYRKLGTTSNYTVNRVTSGNSTKINNLSSGTTYEYRVQTNCPGSNSSYSELKQFSTVTNNQFYIAQKWRMKFYKENNVEVALGANDYMDFAIDGALSQSISIGGQAELNNGTWSFNANKDSVNLNLNTLKRWKIKSLDATNFLLTKSAIAPLTTTDSLKLEKF